MAFQVVKNVVVASQINLVHDWRSAWKWASIRTSVLGFGLMGLAQVVGESWNGMPQGIRDRMPHADTIAMALFAITIMGRVMKTKAPVNGTTVTTTQTIDTPSAGPSEQ